MNKDISKQLDKDQLRKLINVNPDARQYFYSKANDRWLDWLWKNGFLDIIKKKAEDPTRYGHTTPELNYLARMANKVPAKVADIMLKVPISPETFNPEVVARFSQICSRLPADQLVRVVLKIRDDQWIPQMGAFNQWGFEYGKMFKTLAEAKDYRSVLILAEAVLAVRTKKEVEETPRRGFDDNPFYFDDLSYIKIFEHLADIPDEYTEPTLALVTKVMAEVIAMRAKEADSASEEVFKVYDRFMLLDVDFFDLKLGRSSPDDGKYKLAAVIKVLVQKLIGDQYNKPEHARGIYKKYIGNFDDPNPNLPDSRAMWRLRLYALNLCPEVFKNELKTTLFRLFEVERHYEIMGGTEYEKTLQKGFVALPEQDKRNYVKKVMEYFASKDRKEEIGIFSVIASQLTTNERQEAEKIGFKIDPHYQPESVISRTQAGFIAPRGPITQEEFGNLSIEELAEKLRNEWTPEKLAKQNTYNDFLNPRNAEGAGQQLKTDIPKRLQKYIDNAGLFFERGRLDQHYTYSFLHGIQETIKNQRETASKTKWDGVLDLCITIAKSGEKKPFEREQRERELFDAWLAGWDGVHFVMTDVLRELLNEQNGLVVIDFQKSRDRIFQVVHYLLSYPDPAPEDENVETVKAKAKAAGDTDYMARDPFTTAINSVRGRAFEAFVLFVYQDSKLMKEKKIGSDVKELYNHVLEKENTRALMFMFGRHLPSFYFRDKKWLEGLLPHIFPKESEKKHLYLAAWEGYLSGNVYKELFIHDAFQKLYKQALTLTDTEDPGRKHFRDLSEGLATHFALAFMCFEEFGFKNALFKKFWAKGSLKQHIGFVDFLGRSYISGDNPQMNQHIRENPWSKERLKKIWDWLLNNYKDPKLFVAFGFWVNLEKDIFGASWLAKHVRKTLEKTKRILERDYELTQSIVDLAQKAPADALEIARLYLLEGCVLGGNQRPVFDVNHEWRDALQILYGNSKTKSGVDKLIDDLIREGGSPFWGLEEILK